MSEVPLTKNILVCTARQKSWFVLRRAVIVTGDSRDSRLPWAYPGPGYDGILLWETKNPGPVTSRGGILARQEQRVLERARRQNGLQDLLSGVHSRHAGPP